MRPVKFLIIALAVLSLSFSAYAQEKQSEKQLAKPTQKQQIEQMVRDYLQKNPKLLFEALAGYQRKQQKALKVHRRVVMEKIADDIKNNPNDPSVGNPQGDITVVEFFDYRCPFCKKAFPDVQTLIKEDGNIRFVMKEFPILGPPSEFATKAAMAVWLHQKDKYTAFNAAMMKNRGELTKEKVFNYAKDTGIDVVALKIQMEDPLIARTVQATMKQAQVLGINGTPTFIFGSKIQAGAIPLSLMKKLTAQARKAAAAAKAESKKP